ncbi:MAG: hypothetical protein ACK5BE_07075 [Alphaproteobacteria bacterium]|jgi:hypothetical protein
MLLDFEKKMIGFRAWLSGSNQSFAPSTTTKIRLNAKTFDPQNAFDNATNYRFTAKKAGYYYLNSKIFFNWSAITANVQIQSYIMKNGIAQLGRSYETKILNGTFMSFTMVNQVIAYLNVGDYVELTAYHFGATTESIFASEDTTFLEGFYIGN